MVIDLRVTDSQAKALKWIIGNLMTSEVCDDLGLQRVYDALEGRFPSVNMVGISEPVVITRALRNEPAKVEDRWYSWDVPVLDATPQGTVL